jgi:transcriptional regulator with XRE-family HTH domain
MKKNIHSQIRKKIERLLKQRNKSAEKLAFEIGVSKSMVYGYLHGDHLAGVETLQKIAEGLEVKLKDLFPDA